MGEDWGGMPVENNDDWGGIPIEETSEKPELVVPTELLKIGGEMISAPINAMYKGITNLTNVVPAQVKTLMQGGTGEQAVEAGEAERSRIGETLINTPQSKTSEFIGEKIVFPALNWIGEKTGNKQLVNIIAQAGGDIAALYGFKTGAGAVRGIAETAVKKVGKTGLPERLYSSAVKFPKKESWTKKGAGGVSKRTEAARAGLEGGVLPTEAGIELAKNLEKSYRGMVDGIINELDNTGTLIPKERLKAGLIEAQEIATTEGTRSAANLVDRLYSERFNKMGTEVQVGNTTQRMYKPSEIQRIKKHLYKQADFEKRRLSRNVASQIKEVANKGMGHEAKVELENLFPQLKQLNRQDAAYINLVKSLEQAVPRISDTNMVGIGTKILLTGSRPWTSILEFTLGIPTIKAKLAIALNKARSLSPEVVSPATKTLGATLPESALNNE